MRRTSTLSVMLNLFPISALNSPLPSKGPTRLLYEYPSGTWIENIAIRHNGSILFTSLTTPGNIHALNPFDGSSPTQVAVFTGFNSTLGIVETTPDTFFVIASNFSLITPEIPFVNSIWSLNFTDCDDLPLVQKLAEIPQSRLLNGLTKFNDSLLLAADSALGALWAIDTQNGAASIVARDPLMTGASGNGINGVNFRRGTLHFTNYDGRTWNRVTLDANARQVGNVTVVGTSLAEKGVLPAFDDFGLSKGGDAYIATEAGNSIQRVTPDGLVSIVAGEVNSTAIAQPTAARYGRTPRDRDVLYVVTAGGLSGGLYVNGTVRMVGAQIVAVDLGGR